MELKFKFITILIILLGIAIASGAGTFKPFIRSRYSIRWRKTTESPKIWDSSTASAFGEGLEKHSVKPNQVQTDNSMYVTTTKALLKTSTHSTDYDYYNNEVEDGEHKN